MASRIAWRALALVALLLVAFAPRPAAARLRVGFVAGPQWTTVAPYDLTGYFQPALPRQMRTGFAGIALERPLRGGLVLASGLEYQEHAVESRTRFRFLPIDPGQPAVEIDATARDRLRAIALPVRLEWHAAGWRIGAGPEVRWLFQAQHWFHEPAVVYASGAVSQRLRPAPTAQIFESLPAPDTWYEDIGGYRRWSLQAQGVVGRDFGLAGHALRAELRWTEGVTYQQWSPAVEQRLRAGQLGIGMLF